MLNKNAAIGDVYFHAEADWDWRSSGKKPLTIKRKVVATTKTGAWLEIDLPEDTIHCMYPAKWGATRIWRKFGCERLCVTEKDALADFCRRRQWYIQKLRRSILAEVTLISEAGGTADTTSPLPRLRHTYWED